MVSPFSQDRDDFQRLGKRTIASLSDFLNDLPTAPVDRAVPPQELQHYLSTLPLPRDGMSADAILDFFETNILPWPMPIGHKRSYGWINSPPAPIAVLADTVSSAVNMGLDGYDHPSVFLMAGLSQWLMELSGFNQKNGMAILFSGGSSASLNALSVARYKAAKDDGWNIRKEGLQGNHPIFKIYASDQAHSSIQRCVEMLGLGTDSLCVVPSNENFQMNTSDLSAMIEADLAAGHRPFCVVASAGSTNTGIIDPLNDIADLCETHNLWMHIDGAYGGFGGLDPEYQEQYTGLERANSLTLDPHKLLQVPIDCGALLVRDRALNREAFALVPDYLQAGGNDEHSAPWPYEHMFELTFGNRALKTWASIARLGQAGVSELVIRCNRVASLLGDLIEEADDFELLSPVSLSVVNFRYVPKDLNLDDAALDWLNNKMSDDISKSGEAHMPTSKVRGRVCLRVCFLHYENSEDDATHLLQLIRRLAV